MYYENMPHKSWNEIIHGKPNAFYDKVVLFNPKVVHKIKYAPGCHVVDPEYFPATNTIKKDTTSILLRHMRYIGGVERLIARYNLYSQRMCDYNKEMQYGNQYLMKVAEIKDTWEDVKQNSVLVETR
jgi:hypothetical protein